MSCETKIIIFFLKQIHFVFLLHFNFFFTPNLYFLSFVSVINPIFFSAVFLCVFLPSILCSAEKQGLRLVRVMRSDAGSKLVRVMRSDAGPKLVRVMRSDAGPKLVRVMRSDAGSKLVRVMRSDHGPALYGSEPKELQENEMMEEGDGAYLSVGNTAGRIQHKAPFYRQSKRAQQKKHFTQEAGLVAEEDGSTRLIRLM